MKKFSIAAIACVLAIAAVVAFTSSRSSKSSPVAVGRVAPELALGDDSAAVDLKSMRGKTVLVSFWSSADPRSRMANMRYARVLGNDGNDDIVLLSVNFDRSEKLMKMVLEADSLDAGSAHFCQSHERPAIKRAWKIGDELNAYLIAPSGKIAEINPSKLRKL